MRWVSTDQKSPCISVPLCNSVAPFSAATANWPIATTFSNSTVGVDGKSSYTKFTDIFDNSSNDARFIWSSNLLLDNLVLLRKKIE